MIILIVSWVGFLLPTLPMFHDRDVGVLPVGNSLAGFVTFGLFVFLMWKTFKSKKQ
jgi:hypothetical protein